MNRSKRVTRKTPHMLEEAERKKEAKQASRMNKLSKLSDEQLSRLTEEKRIQREQIAARLLLIEEQRQRVPDNSKQIIKFPIMRARCTTKFSLVDHLKSECVLDKDYCFPPG